MTVEKATHHMIVEVNGHQVLDPTTLANYNFTVITNKLARGVSSMLRQQFNIGVVEWRVMVALAWEAPITAKRVSETAIIDKGLISKAFKSLSAKDLISLECLPNNPRSKRAILTKQGFALYDQILPLVLARESALLTGVSPSEITQLFKTLGKIRQNLELL